MNDMENRMLRILIVAIVIGVIVHFMLPDHPEYESEVKHIPVQKQYVNPLTPLASVREPDLPPEIPLEITPVEVSMKSIRYDKPAFAAAFGARSKEVRLILAKMNGGGEDTENAVEMALKYLARIQNSDGSWSKSHPLGSTGLALNAFLGAGYTHIYGEHKETVAKGLRYLLDKRNKENGGLSGENLYSAGIAGVVFVEAYGLTGDEECEEAADKMLKYLAAAQGPRGAWAYKPWTEAAGDNYNYDTSVTGWVLMAFKSAKLVGMPYPKEVVKRYLEYADWVTSSEDLEFGKRKGQVFKKGMAHYGFHGASQKPQLKCFYTMTASTLMCRLYMGQPKRLPVIQGGLRFITEDMPENYGPKWLEKGAMDNYMWYHAAQVGFLCGGEPWEYWNEGLRKVLVENQVKEGAERGSWPNARFRWGNRCEIFGTVMNTLVLETYYRYFK